MKHTYSSVTHDERGFALTGTFVMLILMLTLGSAATMYSVVDLKSTNHYNTGNQAMYASESGLLHALNAINSKGVVNFSNDIVDRWGTVFTFDPQGMPGYGGFTYQVGVTADPASPGTRGVLTAIGLAPNNARRIVRAMISKGTTAKGRGAIYLAADAVATQFSGNGFEVSGHDHDQFGALVPGGVVEAGVATRNDQVTSDVKSSLNNQQKDNIRGLDFTLDPLNPSVVTSGGPSVADLDDMVADILTNPNVVVDETEVITGNAIYGTVASPQITRLTADRFRVQANGNASGAGIMIVEGSLVINGTLDFIGWIIVRGDTIINDSNEYDGGSTTTLGNATVLGALWTGDLVVKVGGSAILDFCEFCLNLVDNIPGSGLGYMPKVMNITSWEEVL